MPGEHEPAVSPKARHLARLYRLPWDRPYAYFKLRTDPLYAAVAKLLLAAEGLPILDIGCGQGLFAFYLRACGHRAPICGIDYDERKIAKAQGIAAQGFESLHFELADARKRLPDLRGHVVILDILQYLDYAGQRALLQRATERVATDGMLIIRSGLKDRSWRQTITLAGDWIAKGCFWMKAAPVCYPDRLETERVLDACGFSGTFKPLWGRTPFNNYLGIFKRDTHLSASGNQK